MPGPCLQTGPPGDFLQQAGFPGEAVGASWKEGRVSTHFHPAYIPYEF